MTSSDWERERMIIEAATELKVGVTSLLQNSAGEFGFAASASGYSLSPLGLINIAMGLILPQYLIPDIFT